MKQGDICMPCVKPAPKGNSIMANVYVIKWRIEQSNGSTQVQAGSETEAINKVKQQLKSQYGARLNLFEVVTINTKDRW